MLEDTAPTARRVLGGAHPLTANIERYLRLARDALRAAQLRLAPDVGRRVEDPPSFQFQRREHRQETS